MIKIAQNILKSIDNLGVENVDFQVAIRKDCTDIVFSIFDPPSMSLDLVEDFIKTSLRWHEYKKFISFWKVTKRDDNSYLIHLKR